MDLHARGALSPAQVSSLLAEARARTDLLLSPLTEEDLLLQHDPLMSPILWDLGHIGHFEEVWLVEKLAGPASEGEGLRGIYNPFENPRATRGKLELPSRGACEAYLERVRTEVLARLGAHELNGASPLTRDGFVYRMVLQHEYQHGETMLQTLQLKQGEPYAAPRAGSAPQRGPHAPEPGTMVRFPAGRVEMGTDDMSAAYDNERPRHGIVLDSFSIDVHPVTNGEYLAFLEDGGYDAREVWSEAGWAWKVEAGLTAPKYWAASDDGWTERFMDRIVPLDHHRPVCHVCYWEAEAYARWAGKRLPTEAEWEAAASWDPETGEKRAYPWGEEAPTAGHANLDQLLFETTPVGSYPAGASPIGCWDMLGNVWEWTSTDFRAYPGYRTFPYKEYSEVFFGGEYKVLRGGSWATRTGAIRNTFRNWDYPIRRQIFSGFRCARDG
jgi:iron(II)-dependent oxidoreductase